MFSHSVRSQDQDGSQSVSHGDFIEMINVKSWSQQFRRKSRGPNLLVKDPRIGVAAPWDPPSNKLVSLFKPLNPLKNAWTCGSWTLLFLFCLLLLMAGHVPKVPYFSMFCSQGGGGDLRFRIRQIPNLLLIRTNQTNCRELKIFFGSRFY